MEKLEQVLYSPAQVGQIQVYRPKSLESLSAISLYTGDIGSGGSGFSSASGYGLGPGIAREDGSGMIERYRAGKHEKDGEDHVNLEYYVPGISKPLINLHIDMKDDK